MAFSSNKYFKWWTSGDAIAFLKSWQWNSLWPSLLIYESMIVRSWYDIENAFMSMKFFTCAFWNWKRSRYVLCICWLLATDHGCLYTAFFLSYDFLATVSNVTIKLIGYNFLPCSCVLSKKRLCIGNVAIDQQRALAWETTVNKKMLFEAKKTYDNKFTRFDLVSDGRFLICMHSTRRNIYKQKLGQEICLFMVNHSKHIGLQVIFKLWNMELVRPPFEK